MTTPDHLYILWTSADTLTADQLGVTEIPEGPGIEVINWGGPLTELLKSRAALLTVEAPCPPTLMAERYADSNEIRQC